MSALASPPKFTDVRGSLGRAPSQALGARNGRPTEWMAPHNRELGRGTAGAHIPFAMNEEESYDELILLEQPVLDDDLVEVTAEPEDDYKPYEEVILLDMMRLEDEDLLDVA